MKNENACLEKLIKVQPSELRIGNWISSGPDYHQVVGISKDYETDPDIQWAGGYSVKLGKDMEACIIMIEPIKLTPEILGKAGFQYEGSEWGDDGALELGSAPYEEKKICFLWVPKKGRYTDKDAVGMWVSQYYDEQRIKIDIKRVKYLHQLQNLYFDLTGKELKIKL